MRTFRAVLLAAALAGACSSSSPTPPTQNDPPSITCPGAVSITAPASPATVAFGTPTVVQGTAPLTTACTPVSGSAFPSGVTTVTCTATDAIQRKATCAFTVTVVAGPQLAVTRFIAFGDSMTYGEDGQDFAGECPNEPQVFRPLVQVAFPYPSLLQSLLDARYTTQLPSVKPDGKPGEAASDPLALMRFQSDVVTMPPYDVVLLMEGANDLGGHEDAAIAGLGSMIDYAKSRGLRVFLATIPPENPNAPAYCPNDRGGDASLVSPFNAKVRALAGTKSVTLVDVEVAFGGNLSLLSLDGLHPTPTGYSIIANAFFGAIRATLEK